MWYLFLFNGKTEIIMLTLKQIKAGRVKEIILGKHPEASDIKLATDDEVKAVIQRVKDEELQREINSRCPCFAMPLSECNCQYNQESAKPKRLLKEAYVSPKDFERVTKPNKPDSFA